jgi:hypothetical protein
MRRGRKSEAQTPSPKKDQIKGSKVNPKGSASSSTSGKSIELSESIINTLENKRDEYNKKHPNGKVNLGTLKAVFRRGAGAYSSSHRPTITGGAPNSRSAWAFARVNKFLLKKGGTKVKAAYVQDDDLMENGGELGQEITCVNCGWHWNTKQSDVSDKYICHKCHFDNRTFYDSDPIGKYHLGGDMSKHLAPNGKPSNLTHEQWHLVRTPEFKAWFGDWENDPDNASKVVDDNGEPLVVYHTTKEEFSKFNLGKKSKVSILKGAYFSNKPLTDWSGFTKEYFLNIKNPLQLDLSKNKRLSTLDVQSFVKERKIIFLSDLSNLTFSEIRDKFDFFDGIIIENVSYSTHTKEYVIHKSVTTNPNQIKLADGSNTTFDTDNPDIRYEEGGQLKKPHTIIEIAEKHKIKVSEIAKALEKGQKQEREHTNDDEMAKKIAKHHLWESPLYYEKLKEMEETFEDGGIFVLDEIALPDTYANIETLKRVLANQGYEIVKSVKNQGIFETGGMVVGKSHQEADENGTGEKFKLKSTGQIVELEGGEAVIVGKAIDSEDKISFDGEERTPREIASYLNHAYGGVKFEKGGHITCGCSQKKYYHGGELPSAVVNSLHGGEAVITKKTMESKDRYEYEGEKLTPRQILSRINHRYGGVSFAKGGKLTKFTNNPINIASKMIYFVNNMIYE